MQYLFFDLECSNCFGAEGKVCEFGAVLIDENFNIIRTYDIPICPGRTKFETTFDKGFEKDGGGWAYEKDYYLHECKELPYHYERIKKVLTDPNILVFGYAVDNDIRYLFQSLKRYNLELLNFRAYDVRLIVSNFYKQDEIKKKGLIETFKHICGLSEFIKMTPHLSLDDAKMTMMVFKEVYKESNIDLNNFIELCKDCSYESISYYTEYLQHKIYKQVWEDLIENHSIKNMNPDDKSGKVITLSAMTRKDLGSLKICKSIIEKNNYYVSRSLKNADIIVIMEGEEEKYIKLKNELDIPNLKFVLFQDFKKNKI